MGQHESLARMVLGAGALVTTSAVAQGLGLGQPWCVLKELATGPIGDAMNALVTGPVAGAVSTGLGVTAGLAGGWLSNRWHDHCRTLAAEFNDPGQVERNHFLRRIVLKAIELGINGAAEDVGVTTHTGKALAALLPKALVLFEASGSAAHGLGLEDGDIDRFFLTSRGALGTLATPSASEWRTFLTESAGPTRDVFVDQAVERAAVRLEQQFPALLLSSAKLASDYDRPAYAALELALTRSLATMLAAQGQQLSALGDAQQRDLSAIKDEIAALRDALVALPSKVEASLQSLDLGHDGPVSHELHALLGALPDAIQSLNGRLAQIASDVSWVRDHLATGAVGDDVVAKLQQHWPPTPARSLPTDNLARAGATPNPAFVGRADELTRLRALIDDPKGPAAVVIVAGAGFGKTELARAFINSPTPGADAGDWDGRWWLDGSTDGELASLTTHIPAITGQPLPPEPTAGADGARARREWLKALRRLVANACSDGRHLLVIDNAESAEQIRDYRPANDGRLVATTRRQPIPAATAATLSLDVLSADDARALLTSMRPDLLVGNNVRDLDALAEHLGYHALGLAYAAALLAGPPRTNPGALLTRLRDLDVGDEGHLLTDLREDALGTDYRLPLAQSLGLLLDELADPDRPAHNPLAVQLAGYAAFCDSAAIPVSVFTRASGADGSVVATALRALHERSIITWTDHLSMHRLTQSLVRSRLRRARQYEYVLSSLASAFVGLFADLVDHTLFVERTAFWPHVVTVLRRLDTPEAFGLHDHLSSHLQDIGALGDALSHIDVAIEWDERQRPADERRLAIRRAARAGILRDRGDLAGALADITHAINWAERQRPVEERAVAIWRTTRACILHDRNDLAGALTDVTHAIEWDQRQRPVNERDVAINRAARASFLSVQGDLAGAMADITYAIDWAERQRPVNERSVAIWRATRAYVLRDRVDQPAALADITHAIAWAERQRPIEERVVAIWRSARAFILRHSDLPAALADINHAIGWSKRQRPFNERSVAISLATRARILQALGDPVGAIADITHAIEWAEQQNPQPEWLADWRKVRDGLL